MTMATTTARAPPRDGGSLREEGPPRAERLPVPALLALAMTGFTAILTETLPAGLLPQIAEGLRVPDAMAGQLVTAYAAGSLVAAIPLVAWTQGWRRRTTLLAAIGGFLVFNTLTAVSTDYRLTLAARFMAGMAAGLAWGILVGYARRMVVGRLQGRALALAMVGTPVALSLGVPAGTFLGAAIGWRPAFLAMSASTLALIAWVLWTVPDYPGPRAGGTPSVGRTFTRPGVRPVLATILAWMTAHNILYTYVAPFSALSGLQARTDLLLLGFGLAALPGIWLTGVLVDRRLRTLVLASLAAFALTALGLGLLGGVGAVVVAGVLVWGLSFGGASTQLQTATGDAAGDGVDLASAMVTTVWNAAIAAGGLAGGFPLDRWGAQALPWAVLALSAAALAIAAAARRHGFRPGPRGNARRTEGVSAASGDDVFVLLVTVPVRRGCEAEYRALVDAVNDAMRHEPTFVNTIVHRSADDPSLFMLYETWRDRDDFFHVQRKRSYWAEYEAKLPGLLRAPRTMQVFDVLRADDTEGKVS